MGENSPPAENEDAAHQIEPTADEDVRVRLPHRRNASPWSRRLIVASVIAVVLLTPLWIDPLTLDILRGQSPTPPPATIEPAVSAPVATLSPQDLAREWTEMARDAFERNVASGWGSADLGGEWHYPFLDGIEVDGGVARVRPLQVVSKAVLTDTVAHDTAVGFTIVVDRLPADGLRAGALLRTTDAGTAYLAGVRITAQGSVSLSVDVIDGDRRTPIGMPVAAPELVLQPGDELRLRAEVTGIDPATISVRAWPAAASEPAHWQLSVIDWTGPLQHEGSMGIGWSILTDPTTDEARFAIDDFVAATSHSEGDR